MEFNPEGFQRQLDELDLKSDEHGSNYVQSLASLRSIFYSQDTIGVVDLIKGGIILKDRPNIIITGSLGQSTYE